MSLRCVLLVAAAFLGASNALSAEAYSPEVCVMEGAVHGMANGDCSEKIGVPVSELEPGDLVSAMPFEAGVCEVTWCQIRAADMQLHWTYWDTAVPGYTLWAYTGFGGGSVPGDPGVPEDMDVEAFAAAFTGAFMLCGLFWGLGKGVSTVVNFLRRA